MALTGKAVSIIQADSTALMIRILVLLIVTTSSFVHFAASPFFAAIRFYNNHPAVGFQDVLPKFYDFYYIKTGVPMLFFFDRFVLYYGVF